MEALDPVDGKLVATADGGGGVHDQRERVDAFEGVLQLVHHLAAENVLGFVDAGRIDQDDLRVFAIQDSLNAVARGLRLGRNDGDFAADELVDQRRFARVGAAYYGDESGFKGHGGIVRQMRIRAGKEQPIRQWRSFGEITARGNGAARGRRYAPGVLCQS